MKTFLSALNSFKAAIFVLVGGVILGGLVSGWAQAVVVAVLVVLEISLSFDNAVINATVLRRMNAFWQKMFMTVGIIVAVVGMRLIFPIVIVAVTAGLSMGAVLDLILHHPEEYAEMLHAAHPAIAAFGGAFLFTTIIATPHRYRRKTTLGFAGLGIVGLLLLPIALRPDGQLQYYLLHSSVAAHDQKNSDTQHAASLQAGIQSLGDNPLGHGLGTAGPATLRTASSDHVIENYYLQIGYETGLIGFALFISILVALVHRIWTHRPLSPAAGAVGAAVIGISLVGLVLPSWTDSSTALIAWITAGAVVTAPGGAADV